MTRPEWVEAGADVLNDNGGAPGSDLHSWRCSDRDRYPKPCTCVAEVVADIIAAVEPLIRADERERVYSTGYRVTGGNHAEAVAARLVEVICAQERELSAPWHLRLWRCGACGLDWLPVGDSRKCPACDLRAQIAQEVRDGCHHWRDDIKPCHTCRPIADRIAQSPRHRPGGRLPPNPHPVPPRP